MPGFSRPGQDNPSNNKAFKAINILDSDTTGPQISRHGG